MVELTAWDHVLALAFGVVVPGIGAWQGRSSGPGEAGTPFDPAQRIAVYWSNSAVLIVLAAVTLWAWWGGGRTLDELGVTEAPAELATGGLLAGLFLALYALDTGRKLGPARIDETRARWRRATPFMPATGREVLHSLSMVTSAAVCEEIVYRGFLVRYVASLTGGGPLGLALAVFLPGAVFGLCHLYQGWEGAAKVGFLSWFFGAIFVVTGSLWIPMALHFGVDLVGSLLGPRLLGPSEGAAR